MSVFFRRGIETALVWNMCGISVPWELGPQKFESLEK